VANILVKIVKALIVEGLNTYWFIKASSSDSDTVIQ